MSADREMDHLENMSGMHSSRYSPGQYATTPEQDAECDDRLHQALAAAHSQLGVTTSQSIQEVK